MTLPATLVAEHFEDRILFGLIVPTVDREDAPDDVLDALDAAGIGDEDYTWLVWRRRNTCFFIFHAPLRVRGVLASKMEGVRVLPLNQVASEIEDNRNQWLSPSSNVGGSAVEKAKRDLSVWMDSLWRHETGIPEVELGTQEEEEEVPDLQRRRDRTKANTKTDAKASVLAAFGLQDAKDSEGRSFNMGVLAQPANDLPSEGAGSEGSGW